MIRSMPGYVCWSEVQNPTSFEDDEKAMQKENSPEGKEELVHQEVNGVKIVNVEQEVENVNGTEDNIGGV